MSVTDMDVFEIVLDDVADCFNDKMKQLFDEEPEIFEGRSSQMDWCAQVSSASDDLREDLDKLILKYEVRLHNGEFA